MIDSLTNNYEHIKFLNGFNPNEKSYLHKYIPYSRFKADTLKGILTFVSPQLWQDPFERLYFEADYSKKYCYTKPEIACLCLTKNSLLNEDAGWVRYSSGDEKIIRVEIKLEELLCQLNDYASKKGCFVYFSNVQYLQRKILTIISNSESSYFDSTLFPNNNFNDDNFVSLLSLKRNSYQFEDEVRVFVIGEKLEDQLLHIDINPENLYKKITLAPIRPFNINDPRFKHYKEIQKVEKKFFEEDIHSYLKDAKVSSSSLYIPKQSLIIK